MTGRPAEGRRRVAIDAIAPLVDGGRFPVKAIVGDGLPVSVDAFPDGHDEIRVRLRHRPPGTGDWHEIEMQGPDEDRWTAHLELDVVGRHAYDVATWVDAWRTWRRDLRIRVDEEIVTTVDLDIGRGLVASAATRASGPDSDALVALADALGTGQSATEAAMSDELATLMDRYPDRLCETNLATPLSIVVDPRHARFGAWYELFPRSAAAEPGRHGTLRDVIERLAYIDDLGFDVLYLPPIHPIGTSFRKGPDDSLDAGPDDPGVPWAIGAETGGHTAIHPQLGDLDDFDALVDAAADRDIRIALDLAFQTSPDHPWVSEHREWYRDRPDGTIQYAENPPKRYQDAVPLDFETADWEGLWDELLSVVRFWIDHGVRIFRVDNPHTKPFTFWEWLIGDIKATDPDVIFLSEAFTRPTIMYHLAKLGFSQSYTYFTWRNTRVELERYFDLITRPPISHTFRANLFTNTPDILHAYLQDGGRAAFEVRLVLAATLGASYGIYGPPFELTESVPRRTGTEEYLGSEKYEVRHWDTDDPRSIGPLIRDVNAIRRAHPALHRDDDLRFHTSSHAEVIAYSKRDAARGDIILCVVNVDPHSDHRSRIGIDPDLRPHRLLGADIEAGTSGAVEVRLGPASRPFSIIQLLGSEAG